jgi:hypothetical protein
MRILHGIEQSLTIITETIFLNKRIISQSKSMKKCYFNDASPECTPAFST